MSAETAETIVTEMLDLDARVAEVAEYGAWLRSEGLPPSDEHLFGTELATKRPIYGIAVASNLRAFRTGAVWAPTNLVPHAINVLRELTAASENAYALDEENVRPPGWHSSSDFKDELALFHQAVAVGKIDSTILSHPMTAAEGRMQVRRANEKFDDPINIRFGAQRLLADANYSTTFTLRTMASAADFPDLSPAGIASLTGNEKMPWLAKTNAGIALAVQAIAREMGGDAEEHSGHLEIVDAGSGSGATLAAIIAALSANPGNIDMSGLGMSLTSIESNLKFQAMLADFSPVAAEQLSTIMGREFRINSEPNAMTRAKNSTLNFLGLDVADTATRMPTADGPYDVAALTENYVFHRLPSLAKAAILGRLGMQSNGVFIFGDLARNGSPANLGFFNFTNNGPLNTGNLDLMSTLNRNGFKTMRTHPNIPDVLAGAIEAERLYDAMFGIAYKGAYIGEILARAA